MCGKAKNFFTDMEKQIELKSGEPRATEFLFQSISIAVQKGNALSIMGTFGESGPENTLEEILGEIN